MEDTACTRCAYGTECTCDYYKNWIICPPPPCSTPKLIRSGGYRTGYRDGWKNGYSKGFRDAQLQEGTVA